MSLLNTRMLNFMGQSDIDKYETRPSTWGGWNLFNSQTNDPTGIISDDLKAKAIKARGSGLQIPVIDYDSGVTIANTTLPLVVTGDPSTSQLYTVTFTEFYFGFLIHPAQHFNNQITMQREFNEQLKKNIFALAEDFDSTCVAALDSAKTQVLSDDLGGRYSLASNVVVAPLAEQDAFIGDIASLQQGNDFQGPFDVVGNQSLASFVNNRIGEQGEFNERNKTYQVADKEFMWTNNLANGVGHKATGVFVPKGSVGYVQQFAADCVLGHKTANREWGMTTLPILNIPMGYMNYVDAVDGSGVSGAATALLTATKAEAYAFHCAMAFLTPYNSAAGTLAGPIMKGAIATT